MAKLELKSIKKTYPGQDQPVIEDLNLSIEENEFLVLVGPSGSGKSTVLRMIAGLEDITDGQLLIDGVLNNNVPSKDRDIAMVFQNYALFPHMSVYKNIEYGLKVRGVSQQERQEKVKQAAEILELEDFLDRLPKDLSGGQQQRVALGRALVREAGIFLMDEPLSNLDASLRSQMKDEIIKLHQQLSGTFIYVTHDQSEAMTLADRIVVMNQGQIMQMGTPSEIYNHPQNQFVAEFMGTPKMNLLAVRLDQDDLVLLDGTTLIPSCSFKNKLNPQETYMLGIRPENIQLSDQEADCSPRVDYVELTGADAYAHLMLADEKIVLRTRPDQELEENQTVKVLFDRQALHLFDTNTAKIY